MQQSNHDTNLVKKRSNVRKEMKLKDMERVNPTDESMSKAKVIKKILDKEPITFFSGKDTADIGNHLKNENRLSSGLLYQIHILLKY